MSQYRTPEATRALLNTIRAASDVPTACTLIIELFEYYYMRETETAVLFDTSTGRPTKFEWIPDQRFRRIFLGGSNCRSLEETDVRLHPTVRFALVQNVVTLAKHNDCWYTLMYRAEYRRDDTMGGGTCHTAPEEIVVHRATCITPP